MRLTVKTGKSKRKNRKNTPIYECPISSNPGTYFISLKAEHVQ